MPKAPISYPFMPAVMVHLPAQSRFLLRSQLLTRV